MESGKRVLQLLGLDEEELSLVYGDEGAFDICQKLLVLIC